MTSPPSLPSSTFSFKSPITLPPPTPLTPTSPPQKQRRVSLALPSSPRLVPAWTFRDDTTVPYDAPKGKVRRIEGEGADEEEDGRTRDGEGSAASTMSPPEKKLRRKWTPEETQMLVDGCNKHGVGNWKAILSDPNLAFSNRSAVDLKDRFRTYFPEAYRTHYPNARTHLPPSIGRPASPISSSTASSSITPSPSNCPTTTTPNTASTSKQQPNRSTHPDGTPLFPLPSPLHPPRRRPFTAEEDAALLAGFRRHGTAWAAIAKEPLFGQTGRRSMDLRDRFRNAWPGEYERAGYKARGKAGAGAKKKDKGQEKMKAEEGDEEEMRGRARIGRARTDEGLISNTSATSEGPPPRRRRRAHTSQGFKTGSLPPSVVSSEDEGLGGGGGAASDYGLNFTRNFAFVGGKAGGEETALVGGMRGLEMAPPPPPPPPGDEAMPDAAPATSPTPAPGADNHQVPPSSSPPSNPPANKYQSFLHHRTQEELLQPSSLAGNANTIGRSAWGTQDWFSPNPRLDHSSYPQSHSSALAPSSFHSPVLDTADTSGFFELASAHGVLERYDLEPAAVATHHHPHHTQHSAQLNLHRHHSHHYHHHLPGPGGFGVSAGAGAGAFSSSPALSFHSASASQLSLFDAPHSHSHSQYSLSEADDADAFDESSSVFSVAEAESEPGGGGGGAGSGGGGFRGFTHHSNTAGDLIFGARTHQPIWSGGPGDAWGASAAATMFRGRRPGLAGIAEALGGGKHLDGDGDGEGAAEGDDEEKALSLFSFDDLVDLSSHEAAAGDAEMDGVDGNGASPGGAAMQVEPPGTPLLRASPAPVPAPARTVHIHHHHHHHHHYAPTAPRSVSVPPGEAPDDALGGLALGQLMSAPATPAIGAAPLLPLSGSGHGNSGGGGSGNGGGGGGGGFTLDPALLTLPPAGPGLGGTTHPHSQQPANVNILQATLMGPGPPMYNLPFLDLHYFSPDAGGMQMQLDDGGWRGGEALDLARSRSAAFSGSLPSSFSGAPQQQQQQRTTVPPPPVWSKAEAVGGNSAVRPRGSASRPLMRSASGGAPSALGSATTGSGNGSGSAAGRGLNHQRGQSAVVRPAQDSAVSPEVASGPKGKRKRASWDGGGW